MMRSRWIIPERVNERIEEAVEKAVEKAMKSQMESTGGIPRAGEVDKVEKEPLEGITLSYIPEEIKDYISKEIHKTMELKKESVREMLQSGEPFAVGALSAEELHVSFPIIDALPNDLRERVDTISQDPDGRIFICFKETKHGADK